MKRAAGMLILAQSVMSNSATSSRPLDRSIYQLALDPAKQICQGPGTIGSARIRGHRYALQPWRGDKPDAAISVVEFMPGDMAC
jgi:hypothetical protein